MTAPMNRFRLALWLLMIVAALLTIRPAIAQTTAPATSQTLAPATVLDKVAVSGKAAVVTLHGVIDEYSTQSFLKRIDQAKAGGATTLILELKTPGGLVSAAQAITRNLREQNVHTIAFVDGYAYSAGIMIGLSCDELVMAPASFIGDCAPIMMTSSGELQSLGATERAKAESPILADFYTSSVRNGYDPLLTASMVTMDRVVHYLQSPDGGRKFVDEKDYETLKKDGWTPVAGVPDPIDQKDTLLTVNSAVAEKLGLSKGTFASPQAFAEKRGLSIIDTYAPSAGENLIGWLGGSLVRGILIVVLMQALYLAFGHPGHGWPEAIAAIALGLLLGVPLLTGFANWLEVLAILIGLVLLALEIFVIPGFGVAGIAGLLLVFGGLVMTFVGSEPSMPGVLPALHGTWMALQRGLLVVTAGLACSMVLWIWLNRYLPTLPYFNRLILTTTTGNSALTAQDRPIETGPAVGDTGIAMSNLAPGGSVKFITEAYPDGRLAAVVSDSGYVPAGAQVIVREVAGNRIVVRGHA